LPPRIEALILSGGAARGKVIATVLDARRLPACRAALVT
jgi:hypothetical protein